MAEYDYFFQWKEEGFSELEQQLREMSKGFAADKVVQATIVKAAKRAMEPVYDAAVSMAPYDNENPRSEKRPVHMRDTIRLAARIPSDSDRDSVYTNPTDIALAIVSVKKSAISLANEFGTSKRAAKPFLRPALARNASTVVDILRSELENIIPAYAKKLERRKKRNK